jgi:hypothetical protein
MIKSLPFPCLWRHTEYLHEALQQIGEELPWDDQSCRELRNERVQPLQRAFQVALYYDVLLNKQETPIPSNSWMTRLYFVLTQRGTP